MGWKEVVVHTYVTSVSRIVSFGGAGSVWKVCWSCQPTYLVVVSTYRTPSLQVPLCVSFLTYLR
jgi:hypothetical protein